MKAKQVEKLLTGVMNNFLNSIQDEKIKEIIKIKSFISGGCIPSMLMGEFVNDFDIYLYDKSTVDQVLEYFKNSHPKDKEKKYHVKLITENAINLSDKIQIIIKFSGKPQTIVEKFDWAHIKSYFFFHEIKGYLLILCPDLYQLIHEKELVYTGSDYPLSSMIRLRKYLKKGWDISVANLLHIALDISVTLKDNSPKLKEKFSSSSNPTLFAEEDEENINIEKDNSTEKDNENSFFEEIFEEEIKIRKDKATFDIDNIIKHINGVDPLTILKYLEELHGQHLTIKEIMEFIK